MTDVKVSWKVAYLSGAAAGMSALVVGHPFDTAKINAQTSHLADTSRAVRLASHSSKMPRANRLRLARSQLTSLYAGFGLQTIRPLFFSSCLFGTYQYVKQYTRNGGAGKQRSILIGAGATVLPVATISCPFDMMRITQQQQGLGAEAALRQIANGTRLFAGFQATLARTAVMNPIFFGTYEYTRQSFKTPTPNNSGFEKMFQLLCAGSVAGASSWAAAYPIDVVKTRFQAESGRNTCSSSRVSYSNIITELYAKQGVSGFTRGLMPAVVRAVPVNAAAILTVEVVRLRLTRSFPY